MPENVKKIPLNDYINNYIVCAVSAAVKEGCPKGINGETIPIAGISGRKIRPANAPLPAETIVFEKGGFFYTITTDFVDDPTEKEYTKEKKKEIFDHILSTFTFIQ